ncbi:reverse gyrase [Oikeobacillus pervagus]|uniref:Reverse gyrase n=1 Tax=Oikeobacillus pervagus TaxID=1325931 RepID=A0AAJ1WHX2_9BACI|nr:reverse gyrase [Oikeobacillus pervagus]
MMKTEGLGTEATRAGIITMLKNRQYIEVKKNQVYATDKGRVLIEAIGDKILASPEMTAKWEQRLREIGEGKASARQFMEQVKKMSSKIIEDAKEMSRHWDFTGLNVTSIKRTKSKSKIGKKIGKCPKCEGDIVDKGQFYGCTNYPKTKCNFTISKKILGKTISQANVKKLLVGEKTNVIKGFKKGEKIFDACLKYEKEREQLSFVFEK